MWKVSEKYKYNVIYQADVHADNKVMKYYARMYLQLPLRQWGAGNVYLLVLSRWKVNIAKHPIAGMGL